MPESEHEIIFDKNISADETAFIAYLNHPYTFEEAVARIYSLANYNIFDDENTDGLKISFEAIGKFNGQIFTLYDYKEDMTIHIGGHDDLDVKNLCKELIKMMAKTKPKEYTAKCHYDYGTEYSWKSTK